MLKLRQSFFGIASRILRGAFDNLSGLIRDSFDICPLAVRLLFGLWVNMNQSTILVLPNQDRRYLRAGAKQSRSVLGGCWDLNGLEGTLGDLNGLMCLKIGLLLLFLE